MLNYLWSGMILIGIVVAAFTGRIPEVTNAALESARAAVTLCITLLGIIAMWTGLMAIAEKSGLVASLSSRMTPLLSYLFPELPKGSKALEHISTNFMANILGLGWAATPAGIKAMQEMQKYCHDKQRASNSMCMFMIINMSSLQLVTVNILAFRTQYGSANPSEIIGPGILVTISTTIVAIIFAKLCEGRVNRS
ncbi:MAG: nucleoside recognition protein [Defluviitaleaceae bacterium]|nr:nucleoside recognition protein [Defluviitaleaceae bacterium]